MRSRKAHSGGGLSVTNVKRRWWMIRSTTEVGVEIDPVPERLDDGDHPRFEGRSGHDLKISNKRTDGAAAKIPQELALELEEDPQHLGNREDDLAVRDVQEECLPHPIPPFRQAFIDRYYPFAESWSSGTTEHRRI